MRHDTMHLHYFELFLSNIPIEYLEYTDNLYLEKVSQ